MMKGMPIVLPGGTYMRGRRPDALTILPSDISKLERIAHSDRLPSFQVRRARIVLGIAKGWRCETLASQCNCNQATIYRTCQRYRHLGLAGLLQDERRGHSGRELQITPCATGPDRPTRLFGTGGQRIAHHSLVEC